MQKSFVLLLIVVVLASCTGKRVIVQRKFYNVDSLIGLQIENLKQNKYSLNKLVEIGDKKDETRFVPDSVQWANELDIFRQLDQINKASFRDAYVVSDTRDTNSNLTVREVKAQRPVPVSSVRFFYLRDLSDLRKIEAVMSEENSLYTNDRRVVIEFEPMGKGHLLHRYRIEGFQKMLLNDSIRFVIAGEVSM